MQKTSSAPDQNTPSGRVLSFNCPVIHACMALMYAGRELVLVQSVAILFSESLLPSFTLIPRFLVRLRFLIVPNIGNQLRIYSSFLVHWQIPKVSLNI